MGKRKKHKREERRLRLSRPPRFGPSRAAEDEVFVYGEKKRIDALYRYFDKAVSLALAVVLFGVFQKFGLKAELQSIVLFVLELIKR